MKCTVLVPLSARFTVSLLVRFEAVATAAVRTQWKIPTTNALELIMLARSILTFAYRHLPRQKLHAVLRYKFEDRRHSSFRCYRLLRA